MAALRSILPAAVPALVLAELLSMLGSTLPRAEALDRRACASSGSKTVYANASGRYFIKPAGSNRHFACSYRLGRTFALERSDFEGEDRYARFRISARFGAYVFLPGCANCDGSLAFIQVQDLRTGRHRTSVNATNEDTEAGNPQQRVTDLELRWTGSAAWIVRDTRSDLGTPGNPQTTQIEVWAKQRGRPRRLDHGESIDADSLILRGTALSWRHAGERRSTTLR